MNGPDATPTPEATPTPNVPVEGPTESTNATVGAFNECAAILAKLHVNDVKKVLNSISMVYFGR